MEEVLIERAVTIQKLKDNGIFDNCDNADKFSKDFFLKHVDLT